jgi:hypothetical protein
MLIDYPHSKNTHNLKVVKLKKLLNIILEFQESFTTCKWGVMYITSKIEFYFVKKNKNNN